MYSTMFHMDFLGKTEVNVTHYEIFFHVTRPSYNIQVPHLLRVFSNTRLFVGSASLKILIEFFDVDAKCG